MRHKSSKLFKLLSILVFLFFIHNLFPQSDKTKLTKIYKKRDTDTEIRSAKNKSLGPVESFHPETEIRPKSKINNLFSRSARTELINRIFPRKDLCLSILMMM